MYAGKESIPRGLENEYVGSELFLIHCSEIEDILLSSKWVTWFQKIDNLL